MSAMTRRRAGSPRLDDDDRRAHALTPAMKRALWWLPADVHVARFASCDRTRAHPKASTLDSLRLRGLAAAVTNTGWWRITDYGLRVRARTDSPHVAERVTA